MKPEAELHSAEPSGNFKLRDLIGVIENQVKRRAVSKDPRTAKVLMRLLESERRVLASMRKAGTSYEDREIYLASSAIQEQIRRLYLQLGMAEMLPWGDWSIGRLVEEISEGTGMKPLNEVEAELLRLASQHGLLNTHEPLKDNKFVHFHAGCGNGALMEHLRRDRTTDPFANGHRLLDYWAEVGMADKIYFTLNDLLETFIPEPEDTDESRSTHRALQEWVQVMSTLLLRRMLYASDVSGHPNKNLLLMKTELNFLKLILLFPNMYLDNLDRLSNVTIRGDSEFTEDCEVPLSRECLLLTQEYLHGPERFLKRYFKPELLEGETSLAERITIYPHRVLLGRFEKLCHILPSTGLFDLVHSYRGSSHLGDTDYDVFVQDLAQRLKPGGVFVDEGFRESWTRVERTRELIGLARFSDERCIFRWVAQKEVGPKAVLIHRALPDGSFYSDGELQRLVLPGSQLLPIDDYASAWPRRVVVNHVREGIRERLAGATPYNSLDPKELRRVRTEFRGRHTALLNCLYKNVFAGPSWSDEQPMDDPEQVRRFVGLSLQHLSQSDDFRAILSGRPVLLGSEPHEVCTFAPWREQSSVGFPSRPHTFTVERLPRNDYSFDDQLDMGSEARSFQYFFDETRRKTPAIRSITLVEFPGCFTNAAMRSMLSTYLGQENDRWNVLTPNPNQLAGSKLEDWRLQDPEGRIFLIGGSTDDAFQARGRLTVSRLALPLLEAMNKGKPLRVAAFCHGHDICLNALGELMSERFESGRGPLQFGYFPVKFEGEGPGLRYVTKGTASHSAVFVRSVYTEVPSRHWKDVIPTCFEGGECLDDGTFNVDTAVPPVGFSFLGGRCVTYKFHPEMGPEFFWESRRYLGRNENALRQTFDLKGRGGAWVHHHHFDLKARTAQGKTEPWVKENLVQPLLLPTLRDLISGLQEELA